MPFSVQQLTCHRLQKPCALQTPAPPRARKKTRPTKVAELERRLDELTNQLHTAQAQGQAHDEEQGQGHGQTTAASSSTSPAGPSSHQQPPATTSTATTRKGLTFSHLFPEANLDGSRADKAGVAAHSEASSPPSDGESRHSPYPSIRVQDTEATSPSMTAATGTTATTATTTTTTRSCPKDVPWPAGADANALLRKFRGLMEPLFPFVVTPPEADASQLAVQRPYLFKGVMVVALHHDGFRQLGLGAKLLEEITAAAFTAPQKSLDLLQGLELLIAWFQYSWNSFQLTNLLFLARSMCTTLEFKTIPTSPQHKDLWARGLSLEHCRAFAGCYYLNTLVFTVNKRPDAFINTTYADECCKPIQERAEYSSDELLVHLVRIQQLAQSILGTMGPDTSTLQSMQLPMTVVAQSFQQQLDAFKAGLPEGLKTNEPLLAHMAVAEVLLYEASFPDVQSSSSSSTSPPLSLPSGLATASPLPPPSYLPHNDRLALLWRCSGAAKSFMSVRLASSTHNPRFVGLADSEWLYVLVVGIKLHTLQVPGWDLDAVRTQMHLGNVVDKHLENLDRLIETRRRGWKRAGVRAGVAEEEEEDDDDGSDVEEVERGSASRPSTARTSGLLDPLERIRQVTAHVRALAGHEYKTNYLDEEDGAPGAQTQGHGQGHGPCQGQRHEQHQGMQQQQQQQLLLQRAIQGGVQNQGIPGQFQEEAHQHQQHQQHQHPQPHQQQHQLFSAEALTDLDASLAMLRDWDGSFWQEAFDDPFWTATMDMGGSGGMDWTGTY